MPIHSGLPITNSSIDKINNMNAQKLLINNDENHTCLEQQTNQASVSKVLPIAPRSVTLADPHLLKPNSVDGSRARCKHVSTSTSSDYTNIKAVPNNEQSPTDSTLCSIQDNTRSTRNTQTTRSEHDLNSQDVASVQFSIQIPVKHLHKLYIDPSRISYETTHRPEPSRHANTILTEPTISALKCNNANVKSSQFIKYSFHTSPMDRNILRSNSSVDEQKTLLRSSNELKNVALDLDSIDRESRNSNSCTDVPIDLSMHARSDLNTSDTLYQKVESKIPCTVNTKADSQELRYGNECCYCPVHFVSSSSTSTSTNIHLNCQPVQQQSQTEYHTFENSREKLSGNNIIMDHTSSQLNQNGKGVEVISKYVQTSTTESTCSFEHTVLSSSGTKMPTHVHSANSTNTLKVNDSHSNENSTWSDGGLSCALDFTADWSETNESDQDFNSSINDPLKSSNPCQLGEQCSQEGCKCLLWTDGTEKHTHNWEAREASNHFRQNMKGYIIDSQNQSKRSQIQSHSDSYGEHDSKEQKSALPKPNFVLRQMEKERSVETNDRALRKSKEIHKKRQQKRPSYKLHLDSSFPDNCKFAQHVERGEPERTPVAHNLSHACPHTDQASNSCLKRNNERKSVCLKKVHFSQGINSQIISPLYETSLAKNDDHNFLISSNITSYQKTHILQSTAENKKLHSRHSILEQQLKSKLRYGIEPLKMNEISSTFEDTFDVHSTASTYLVLAAEDEGLPKRSTELLSTTSCTDNILSDSIPVTSMSPTSSQSGVNPHELYTTPPSLEHISNTYLHNTNNNLINTAFLNPHVAHWNNNSLTSMCNLSALDVSNEMDQHASQGIQARSFLSEIPINTASQMSSSTTCKSDSGEVMKHIISSNNESLSYPMFSQVKTNADDKLLHRFFPLAISQTSEGPENLHRVENNCPYNRTSNLKEPVDMMCKHTSPKPVQKLVETHNNPGKVSSTNERNANSLEKYSDKCRQILSENMAYEVKGSKQMNVIYKQWNNNYCTETVPNIILSSQGSALPSLHSPTVQGRETSMLEIYKNNNWEPESNKQLKISKPNWDELANTVNKLQMICNDHAEPTQQTNSSACSTNNSIETQSILAAQACVETLQKQLGIRGQHDHQL